MIIIDLIFPEIILVSFLVGMEDKLSEAIASENLMEIQHLCEVATDLADVVGTHCSRGASNSFICPCFSFS